MNSRILACALACLAMSAASAHAHGVAGDRIFPATLNVDDPAVADELAIPTVTWQRNGVAADGSGPSNEYDVNVTFAKRITDHFGVSIQLGHNFFDVMNGKSMNGWQNIRIGAKYQAYVNPEHELLVSVGVLRELPRTGTASIGSDSVGTTTPTLYFGKGLGDLPIGGLRPLAITGTAGVAISDKTPNATGNGGHENRFAGGLTVQYSIPYLESQVKNHGLPGWIGGLTPLVEIAYSSPISRPSTQPMQLLIAPGVVYSADTWQFAVEALIPANRNTGTNVGVIAEFHLYLDDILPRSLGTPVVNWFR